MLEHLWPVFLGDFLTQDGDKSIFVDSLVLREGHAWTVDEVCSSEWSSWQLATPSVLSRLPRGADYQYKYQDSDSGAFYLTPVTQLVWAWDVFQGLSGEYMFETADGVQDSFSCTDTEQGMVGVGCSNGGGARWKVFSWVRHTAPSSHNIQRERERERERESSGSAFIAQHSGPVQEQLLEMHAGVLFDSDRDA